MDWILNHLGIWPIVAAAWVVIGIGALVKRRRARLARPRPSSS